MLLGALPVHSFAASQLLCPEGVLDGKVKKGGPYYEEFYACYKGKIYPKNLKYCAPYTGQDEGFYEPTIFKCVNNKIMTLQQEYCYEDIGPGGIYTPNDHNCNKGIITHKANNLRVN